MDSRLQSLLTCPACGGLLEAPSSAKFRESALCCASCSAEFPFRGGIPRFVPSAQYAASFSFEWKHWRRTQFDTPTQRASETTFVASTGLGPDDLHGKLVLDVGCGAGRYLELVTRWGAEAVGIDLSEAVEVAYENLHERASCHFLQGDLHRLPFAPATFDIIYSIGVLHHTPSTRRAFESLVPLLKPGGTIAIWVYPLRRLTDTLEHFPDRVNEVLSLDVGFRVPDKRRALVRRLAPAFDWTTETSSDLERIVTTRLPPRTLYALCHAAIPLYYLYRIPLFYPLRLVTKIAMDPDPEWRVLHTFDWYSPHYQWKHTWAEVKGWFEEAGLEKAEILPRAVAVRGSKPK